MVTSASAQSHLTARQGYGSKTALAGHAIRKRLSAAYYAPDNGIHV